LRPDALGQQLPRHDITVVLHFGEQNLVTAPDVPGAPGLSDEVEASVVPRVKMISSALRAFRYLAARARAASKAAVARLLNSWIPRWTFALSRS